MGNRDGFFREFTLRICGSLNIAEALWKSLLYVRKVIPADELVLTAYDQELGALEIIARADEKNFTAIPHRVQMQPHIWNEFENAESYPPVRICNDVAKDHIIGEVARHFNWPDCSVIVARLIIEHKYIGSIIARADGKGRYGKEDGDLWTLVNEPLAIALDNSRQYLELLKLKDILADDNRYLYDQLRKDIGARIVGASFGLRGVMDQVYKVAPLTSPVLLLGETGSGKGIIANAIHDLSPRNNNPLITVSCGAVPESLIDSELFGHEKGAFTGALTERIGRFERADKGTIFLDEVGELPLNIQARLLRVLQEKEIERVGGSRPIKVDIRIISATHRNLEKLVSEGAFREDLYYRLGVYPIRIPPLRDRRGDIPALVEHFIERKSHELNLRSIPTLAPGVMDRLVQYDWPGNVREAANVIERAIIQSDGKHVTFDDIVEREVLHGVFPRKAEALPPEADPAFSGKREGLRLDEVAARHIRHVMEMTGGKIEGKNGTASILGVNPATLRYRMRKLRIPFGRSKRD